MLTWKVIYYYIRQPYFFVEPKSKTEYWFGVCHGWLHLQGLPRAVRNASRARITKSKILSHCGTRTRGWTFRLWRSPGFNCSIFFNLPATHSKFSKIICRVLLSHNICTVLLFDQLKSLPTVKSLQNVIHGKLLCFIYHVLQVNV